jgi:3'-phosphoadenosine 5'-phosphosulfate sulfotransferase (PAPS reductase)/FAD synthetase
MSLTQFYGILEGHVSWRKQVMQRVFYQNHEVSSLFTSEPHGFPPLETTPTVVDLIAHHAPIAVGVSGGKDSDVTAFETQAYLKTQGHQGPLILIHSDLGRIEHKDSLPACQRLADRLGLELVIVRRKSGDMMDRWLQRWRDNFERYRDLLCVKLILPWSTASMRFCTSELKTAIICRYLVERFPGLVILSVLGIRREESTTRALAPVCSLQQKLENKTFATTGYNWNPILPWTLEEVLAYHAFRGFPLHEAYTKYGMSRVSCAYCILSSLSDLVASATNPDNHDIYREMVDLEIISSFSFQSDQWLGDIAPQLLSLEQLTDLSEAKRRARARSRIEAKIPTHLLFKKNWPRVMPTRSESVLLSEVRRSVADIMQIAISYSEPDAILERYAELMAIREQRGISQVPAIIRPIQHQLWNEGEIA